MIPRRLTLLSVLAIVGVFGAVATAPASAATVWNLELHHNQTNFPPGGSADYWINVNNVGDTASSGPITLTVDLPAGVTFQSMRQNTSTAQEIHAEWTCAGPAGGSVVTCTTSSQVPRHRIATGLVLTVGVDPLAAEGEGVTTATLAGGGALATATDVELVRISSTPASFGIVPGSFAAGFFAEDGLTPVREAGAHPDLATFAFDFNSIVNPLPEAPNNKVPAGFVRDLTVDLPPGFVGYPSAVGECEPSELIVERCPPSSQVGVIEATTEPILVLANTTFTSYVSGVYNMVHPRGTVTDLGLAIAGNAVHVKVSLDAANDYAVRSTVSNVNESSPVFFQKLTLWGVPADPGHDSQRCQRPYLTESSCSTDAPLKPFLTVPSQCGVNQTMRLLRYDSWQATGVFGPEVDDQLPGETTNCDRPRFEPAIAVHPTSQQANTPTGLEVQLKVPQNDNPNGLATPPVKSIAVTLPEGMALSPAAANGLASCSEPQIGLGTDDPITCPDSSRIGTVKLKTPVLGKELEGTVYLAAQKANPFGSTFAIYLAIHDTEERGVLVKLPGKIALDQATGRITTTFDELPQLPFEEVDLTLRSGNRAPLVNPPVCGTETVSAQLASWARPDEPVSLQSSFGVGEGPEGSACPAGIGGRPFAPGFSAGTLNPVAGAYSPFVLRVTRPDADQDLSRIDTTLPEGLLAKIAGIPYCPEAALAAIGTGEGTGVPELARPTCPASQIGTVSAGVGSGPEPDYFPGKVYLAGPYKSAPLSLAIIVPAVAGPFDLGNVLVRAGIFVDPATAQVKAVSDPFPTILYGVPLHQRDIRLNIDRPETTMNPTSCEPTSVKARVSSTTGSSADLSNRFQVGDCAALPFKPKLALRVFGPTHRNAKPRLRAVLTTKPGEANIRRAQVNLPHSEFLEQGHIKTVCTRVQFAAGDGNGSACPKGSIYGRARAFTPLLDKPLEGPVYLRSSSHKLPDLVAALNGQIDIALDGTIDSGKNQGIRNTFEMVPDAPVSKFILEMRGGRRGLLVNSEDLCRKSAKKRAIVRFVGHNGKVESFKPKVANSCGKKHRKHKRHQQG